MKSITVRMIRLGILFVCISFVIIPFPVLQSQSYAASADYFDIKSVTYYDHPNRIIDQVFYDHLAQDLPKIKGTGFNTIWFVLPWVYFNPQALPTSIYSDDSFNKLKAILELLKQNNMRAILPLNYLWSNTSGHPAGIDYCTWISNWSNGNKAMFQAFVTYVNEFLTRISDYSDMVYIMVFTEGSEPCGVQDAKQIAAYLRPTLGNLPNLIRTDLRLKFRIGYHDYSLINLGSAGGESPIKAPISFDFLSMVAYGLDGWSDSSIRKEVNTRASRFKSLYSNTPLIIGEFGGKSSNGYTPDNQNTVINAIISYALENRNGFNLWGWQTHINDTDGLGIIDPSGVPRLVVGTIKSLLSPRIEQGGVVVTYQPWAVWLSGKNFNKLLQAKLFDGVNFWAYSSKIALAQDYSNLSFQLPADVPPSQCNVGKSCSISVQLYDQRSTLSSRLFSVNLPQVAPPTTPSVKDEGQFTSNINQLYASWTSLDSDIVEYQYKITQDSATSGTVVRNWTSTGATPYVTAGGLSLTVGKAYYFKVKAKNKAGAWSAVGNSDGIIVDNLPQLGSVTPASGSSLAGTAVNFSATYSDPDGWQNIQKGHLLVNTSTAKTNCLYAYYDQNTNKLYLINDANTSWLGGYAPGTANVIGNSYAKIDCSRTTISGSGNTLTINWNVTFKSTFKGTKNSYLKVTDDSGAVADFTQKGTWTIQ